MSCTGTMDDGLERLLLDGAPFIDVRAPVEESASAFATRHLAVMQQ